MAIRAISAAYFVGEILIPNISGTTTTERANLLPLQVAMAKYESVFLTKLLGKDLYDLYVADIALVTPSARFTALNNLIYYTDAALTALGTGISPVAYYIYFFFMRSQSSITLTGGEGLTQHENFTQYGAREKMIYAWNEMVRLSQIIQDWLVTNIATYPEYYTNDAYADLPSEFTIINRVTGC